VPSPALRLAGIRTLNDLDQERRVDMPRVQWLWVLVGVAFIYGSQLLLGLVARAFGAGVEQLAGLQALFLAFTLFAFFLGGFVVGLFSPGTTIVEPPLAAFVAAVLDAVLPPATAAQLAPGSWLVIVMTGFLLAFVGGWMGEKLPTPAEGVAPRVMFWVAVLVLVFGLPAGMVGLGVPVWLTALLVLAVGAGGYWRLAR
jgi:hypothetical protein